MNLNFLLTIILGVSIVLFLLFVGECFKTWSDFFKCFGYHSDLRYRCLFFVLRRSKNLRFVENFPSDLRRACLDKDSVFSIEQKDSSKVRHAKEFARQVLGDDAVLNEYFKGHYLTYDSYQEIVSIMNQKNQNAVTKQDLISDISVYFRDRGKSEHILDVLLAELKNNRDKDDLRKELHFGVKCAILYHILASMSPIVFPQKNFALILERMKAYDDDIEIRAVSTLSKYSYRAGRAELSENLYCQEMKTRFGCRG